jgi:hypothetical protein
LEDWGKLIGDVPSATAILDRFLHHADVLTFSGKSYRLRKQPSTDGATDETPKSTDAPPDSAAADEPKPNRSSRKNRNQGSDDACQA